MSPRIRKATAVVTAAALMGGSGIGIAQAATGSSSSGDRPAHRGGGPLSSATLAKIAAQLGVTTTQLKAAMAATKPAKPAAGTDRRAGRATELATALASGLGIDEATVTAAFTKIEAARKAEHTARETAMYAALAKELGLSTDAVRTAFEANRPAKPAKRAA